MITAPVLCADETPLRAGPSPRTRTKYLLVACTNLVTYYYLGGRDLGTFGEFVFPDLSGTVLVHDRYANYDSIPGVLHQPCTAHILHDLEDCAQAYPDAVWPGQAAEALRGLIHAANVARDKGLASAPAADTAAGLHLFRNAVLVGLQEIPRVPGANARQKTGRCLLECLKDREDDVLRFLTGPRIPPTSNQAERDLRAAKPRRRSPAGSAPRLPPGTGTRSGVTSTPPASTAGTS